MKTALYLIHALSPLHAGTGQSVGAIDLPIARERPTGIPLVPGSSVKGALRAAYEGPDKHTLFGPDTEHASEFAGALQFSDAHLLLLPVRTVAGTFAWVTSPYLLQRFARDAKEAIDGGQTMPPIPIIAAQSQCMVTNSSKSTVELTLEENGKTAKKNRVILEDYDLEPTSTGADDASNLAQHLAQRIFSGDFDAWRQTFVDRFCIVHDDVMALLLETATEVTARIRLNEDSKTVDKGALWYEEALPTESILYGLVVASKTSEKIVNDKVKRHTMEPPALLARISDFAKSKRRVQLGGKATVGRGMCLVHVLEGGAS